MSHVMTNVKFLKIITPNRKFYYESVSHSIQSETPHPNSWAGAVLLKQYYSEPRVKGMIQEFKRHLRQYKKFRKQLLAKSEKENGRLSCYHCGNYPLQKKTPTLKLLATLDHIIPVSKGGPAFDPDNIVISCSLCNSTRGCKDLKNFRPKRTELNLCEIKIAA